MTLAYIGLGSNLEDPRAQVQTALDEVGSIPGTRLLNTSSLYRSAPQGPQDQPDFINAVAEVETTLPADALLGYMQDIEQRHGRARTRHWGPRTLDLDLLLYGNMKINGDKLTLPHPHIASRNFVLCPLLELDPQIEIPDLGPASVLLEKLSTVLPVRI
jgi:2-amino-4-hydroxy-6-hydroxymethyldihydropteridine diphosphokinase